MSKTLTTIKLHLSALRDLYVIPAEAKATRDEIRRIVSTFSFESNVADLRYEDLDSAAELSSK